MSRTFHSKLAATLLAGARQAVPLPFRRERGRVVVFPQALNISD